MAENPILAAAVNDLRRARERGEAAFDGCDYLHAARLLNGGIEAFLAAWHAHQAAIGDPAGEVPDADLFAALASGFERLDRAAAASGTPAHDGELVQRLSATARVRRAAKPGHEWRNPQAGEALPGQPSFIGDEVCERCGLWIDYTGVAPAFYHPDGYRVEGDENACDGPNQRSPR